jgi:hypothetical protein
MDRYLTATECAKIAGYHPDNIRRWLGQGILIGNRCATPPKPKTPPHASIAPGDTLVLVDAAGFRIRMKRIELEDFIIDAPTLGECVRLRPDFLVPRADLMQAIKSPAGQVRVRNLAGSALRR